MVLNKIILWGRLTADPELRQTPSGKSVTKITLAVPRKKFGNEEEKTDFISVQLWNKQAEFVARYFGKGSAAFVAGTLQNNNYTDKNGVKRYDFLVLAEEIQFGESKANANSAAARGELVQAAPYQPNTAASQTFDSFDGFEEIGASEGDGELPF